MRSRLGIDGAISRSRAIRRGIVILGALAALGLGFCREPWIVAQILLQDPNRSRNADQDGFSGVYLPTDRTVARAMSRVRQRLAEREFHQSLTFLQEVLQREEDAFLEDAEGTRQQRGLKATARQMIGQLPAEGLDAYELLHGAAARRQLEAALEASDQNGIAAVVRQYFHTIAGYEAALVLAQMEADQGHHLAAAQLYQELIAAPRAATRFEPQLSLLAALNHMAANKPESAAATLGSLIEKRPGAAVELFGKSETLPTSRDEASEWVSEQIAKPLPTAQAEVEWLTARGNAMRNSHQSGGQPHLRPRWEARVVNDPSIEAHLLSRSEEFNERGIVTIPVARPIAVDNLVVMRTPQNVVAIDYQTGKRVWETREDEELESREGTSRGLPGGMEDEQFMGHGGPFEQRMWDDGLVMSLTSDGERVYVLRGDTTLSRDEFIAMQMAPNFNRRMGDVSAATNRLAAYDIRTEGKLAWELDGARASGPLEGAFILGPPIAVDGTLFMMVEVRSAAYLVALDPATGRVRWQQQLVGLEQGIGLDPARRRVGATPSYAGGILVCPTAAGAVVAIDVVKREFAWVYRYRRESPAPGDFRNVFQPQIQAQLPRSNDRWLDSLAIISENRVLITPPESADLHCIDLATGQQLWIERQGDALFVGGVDEERVLLVGPESVRALRASDGTPAWDKPTTPLPSGALPAGHGYMSEGKYYLPLTSGQIATIDMADGRVSLLEAGPQGQMLGNLICYRGSVLSQSAVTLSKFEQLEVLQQRATAALSRNSSDATALRELAELKLAKGRQAEALLSLKRALELSPEDTIARDMLADLLLEALAVDFNAHRGDIRLLSGLLHDRDQQLQLLRLEAEGLQQLGERTGAWDAYLRIADLTADEPAQLAISRDYSVRSDRWICGRVGRLWSEATATEQAAFAAQLAERRERLNESETLADLRHYLRHFELLPGASDIRRQLVESLTKQQRFAEAEIELLEMSSRADREERAAAAVLMSKLLLRLPKQAAADPWISLLADQYADTVALDDLKGGEWSARLAAESSLSQLSPVDWPRGHVDVETTQSAAPVRERPRGSRTPERQSGFRPLRIEQDFGPVSSPIAVVRGSPDAVVRGSPDPAQSDSVRRPATTAVRPATTAVGSPLEWYISADCSALVGRSVLGKDVFHLSISQNNLARQQRKSEWAYGARLGNQMYVALGGQVIAIDTRQTSTAAAGANLLWQTNPQDRYLAMSAGRRRGMRSQTRSSRQPVVYHAWSSRKRSPSTGGTAAGSLGPVTPRGVVFQEDDELKCVDPLSGDTLWSRTDLPPGCELFGDQEFVFAADMGEDDLAFMFRMVDGQLVGKRDLTSSEWLLTAGRNVAQLGPLTNGDNRVLQLRVTDVASQEALFEAEYAAASRAAVVEPNTVVMLEPSGKFQLIDVGSGQPIARAQLEPVPALHSLQGIRSGDTLFLLVGTRPTRHLPQQHRPVDLLENVVTSGFVYAFDLTTGEALWPGPATIQNRGLVAQQPDGIPLMIFLDRQTTSDGVRGAKRRLRMLCLDKRTGETVYRNDELPDMPVMRLRIYGAPPRPEGTRYPESPHVTVETNAGTIRLALSDRPRPPRPPANDELEASRADKERGLVGLGQRMGAALRGTILKGQEPAPQQAPEPIDDD